MKANHLRVVLRGLALVACACAGQVWARGPDKFVWPEPAAELRTAVPPLEEGAAVEALVRRLEIDDRNYPKRRVYRSYWCFRIFDPARASNYLSFRTLSVRGRDSIDPKVRARLRLPDGRVREFGAKDFLQRESVIRTPLASRWWWRSERKTEITERLLAVPGVERDSLLEYIIEEEVKEPTGAVFVPLQVEEVATRRFEMKLLYDEKERQSDPPNLFFLSGNVVAPNTAGLQWEVKNEASMTATDLPAVKDEPFSGPITDRVLTLVIGNNEATKQALVWRLYSQQKRWEDPIKSAAGPGPWATLAGWMFMWDHENVRLSSTVKQRAKEIVGDARSPLEQARKIHHAVLELRRDYRMFAERARLKTEEKVGRPEQVLDFRKQGRTFSDESFLVLALSLYRAVGLEAASVGLPDRGEGRLNVRRPLKEFLPGHAIGIDIDGRWYFSAPHYSVPFAFGMLPWQFDGQVALVARAGGQQFVPVPTSTPEQTHVSHDGDFKLDAAGHLAGRCRSSFTGHIAAMMRLMLVGREAREQRELLEAMAKGDMERAQVTIIRSDGLDAVDGPVVVEYDLRLENYADIGGDDLVVRPAVFRFGEVAPLTKTERRTPLVMPFRWKESDQVTLEWPEEFAIHEPAPLGVCPGDVLNHKAVMHIAPGLRRARLEREFTSNFIELPVKVYGSIKAWYESVSHCDQYELMLRRTLLVGDLAGQSR